MILIAKDVLPAIISQIPLHSVRLLAFRLMGAKIGSNTSIHRGCQFYNICGLNILSNTVVNGHVVLDARRGLFIGRNVSISEYAMLYTLQHDLDSPDFAVEGNAIIIQDYVFIGPRVIVLPGVTLGEGCAIAAGSVVAKNVEPYAVVAGSPAKPVRKRSQNLRYELNYRRSFY